MDSSQVKRFLHVLFLPIVHQRTYIELHIYFCDLNCTDIFVDSFVANVARILHLDGANTFKLLSEKAPASNYPDIQKDEARYFDLDRQSGIVTLRHLLDRDTLCSDVDVCTFHLKVSCLILRRFMLNVIFHLYLPDHRQNLVLESQGF